MKPAELLTKVKAQLTLCAGWDGDAISTARKQAHDYYFQRPRGDEIKGRSTVVSGDLSAMVEAQLAGMMHAFGHQTIAEYCAFDAPDEAQAKLESDTANYLVMGMNNGFYLLSEAIKNALMLRNGLLKVYIEDRHHTETRTFQNVEPEAAAELTNIPGAQVTIKSYSPESKRLQMKVKRRNRKFCVHSVAPENFLYLGEWHSHDLQAIPFCAERHIETRAEMVSRGFPRDKVEKLTQYGANRYKSDAKARQPRNVSQNIRAVDKSQEEIEWYECYVLMDGDDGESERHQVCISGDQLLRDELYMGVPYISGCVMVNPGQYTGISLHDKLKMVQDINTGLYRGLLDNVNAVNKSRLAYLDGKVNPDDLADGRVNNAIRVKANVASIDAAVKAIVVPDASGSIIQAIDYTTRKRSEMGGAALDMATGQMQMNDRLGSQGLDRAYSVMEQLAEYMTLMIGCTLIRSLYLKVHEVLRTSYNEPVPVKRDGRWQSSVPAQWPARSAVKVKPGMSPGERARRSAAMRQIILDQVTLAEKGMEGVLVDTNTFYEAVLEWARLNDVPNPEQYFIDPRTPRSEKAMNDKAAASQQQTAKQDMLMQVAMALEQMRVAQAKYNTDVETQFKYFQAILNSEVEEAKIVGKATTDLIAARDTGNDKAEDETGGKATKGKPPTKRGSKSDGQRRNGSVAQ